MNEKLQRSRRRKRILFSCIAASLILHIILICIVYKNPVVLKRSFPVSFGRTLLPVSHEEDPLELLDKSKILEEVFDQMTVAALQRRPLENQQQPQLQKSVQPLIEKIDFLQSTPLFLSENIISFRPPSLRSHLPIESSEETLLEQEPFLPTFSFSQAPAERFFSLPPLPKENFQTELPKENFSVAALPELPPLQEEGKKATIHDIPFASSEMTSLSISEKNFSPRQPLLSVQAFNQPLVPSMEHTPPLPKIAEYDLPEVPLSVDWSEYFEVDVQVAQDPIDKRYLFTITLKPWFDLSRDRIKQNFIFLIDRSNSVEKMRYESFKKATLRALSVLKEGDAFNIIIFDRKIYRLSDAPLPFSKATLSLARSFLESKPHGDLFAATEIYQMLQRLLNFSLPEEEVQTVFLLSDGNTLLNLKKQQKALLRFTEENDGKRCIYAVAAGSDNNLILLDLLSSSNRGRLIYSRTQAALPRKLAKAVMEMRDPLAKEISVSAAVANPNVKIELFPPSYRTPTLYDHEPYYIFGKIDKLIDFTLLLDGHNQDQWIGIQKQITFEKYKKRTALLEKKWALQEAKNFYEAFLQEGKPALLKKAEETLKAYGGGVAYE
jgi:hypothetical protein